MLYTFWQKRRHNNHTLKLLSDKMSLLLNEPSRGSYNNVVPGTACRNKANKSQRAITVVTQTGFIR